MTEILFFLLKLFCALALGGFCIVEVGCIVIFIVYTVNLIREEVRK